MHPKSSIEVREKKDRGQDVYKRQIINSPTSSMEKKAETLVMTAVRTNTRSQDNTSVAIVQYDNMIINKH